MSVKRIVEWWVDLETGADRCTVIANQNNWKAVVKELREAALYIQRDAQTMGVEPDQEDDDA